MLIDPRLQQLDLTHVKEMPGPSCAFQLSYTPGGALASIDCSYGVAESLTSHCLSAIGHHDSYHVCCRRPLDVRAVLSRLSSTALTFSADFHMASAAELITAAAPYLPRATAVFVNAAEFAVLAASVDPGRLAVIVVSDGPREVVLLRHGRPGARIRPPLALPVVEVTGAGDTLAGTFLAGLSRGLGDADALEAAAAAAAQSISVPGLAIADG
jgi:sugar/nucleoside kinase (ribokinase family)